MLFICLKLSYITYTGTLPPAASASSGNESHFSDFLTRNI